MEPTDYDGFKTAYLQEIKILLRQRGYPEIQPCVIGEGLSFEKVTLDLGNELCHCVDIEEIYSEYVKGDYPMHSVARQTLDCFRDFGIVQREQVERAENVLTCAVNLEKSKETLRKSGIPHFVMDDMAIYFRFDYEMRYGGTMESIVSEEHLQKWNCSVEEFFDIAKQNDSQEIGACAFSWEELPLFGHVPVIVKSEDLYNEPYDLYGLNGAGVIFYPKVLRQFEEVFNDQILIVPYSERKAALFPAGLVQETWVQTKIQESIEHTETRLSLSKHVYTYDNGKLNRFKDIEDMLSLVQGTSEYKKEAAGKRQGR